MLALQKAACVTAMQKIECADPSRLGPSIANATFRSGDSLRSLESFFVPALFHHLIQLVSDPGDGWIISLTVIYASHGRLLFNKMIFLLAQGL